MSDTTVNSFDGEKIIKIVEQLKTEILRDLPTQKDYLSVQEKIKNNLENLELNQHENELVVKTLKLELNKFSKSMEQTKNQDIEQFNDLLATLDSGFSEFHQKFMAFKKEFPNLLRDGQKAQTSDIIKTFQSQIHQIEKQLTPLQNVLSKEQFLQNFNHYVKNVMEFSTKTEQIYKNSAKEIISNQKRLATNEQMQKTSDTLQKSLNRNFKELNTQISKNSSANQLEKAVQNLSVKSNSNYSKILSEIGKIPLKAQLQQLQTVFQKEINEKFQKLVFKYEKSPVPLQIENLQKKLVEDLKQMDNELHANFTKSINIISSKDFFAPVFEDTSKKINEHVNLLEKNLKSSIIQQTQSLAQEKSSREILNTISKLKTSLQLTSKESSLQDLHKEISSLPYQGILQKIAQDLTNLTKEGINQQDYKAILTLFAEIKSKLNLQSEKQSINELQRIILEQNAIPNVNKLHEDFSTTSKTFATQQNVLAVRTLIEKMNEVLPTLGSNLSQLEIKKAVESKLPQKMEEKSKEILKSQKDAILLSQTNKEFLIRLNETLPALKSTIQERATTHQVNNVSSYLEKTIPELLSEIQSKFIQLQSPLTESLEFQQNSAEKLKVISQSSQHAPEIEKYLKEVLAANIDSNFGKVQEGLHNQSIVSDSISEIIKEISQKSALESSINELRKNVSDERFTSLMTQITQSIIPVIKNQTNPLVKAEAFSKFEQGNKNQNTSIISASKEISNQNERIQKSVNESQLKLNSLPLKVDFEEFRESVNENLEQRLPSIITTTLEPTAKEDTITKLTTEIRKNFMELFQIDAVIQNTTKDSSSLLQTSNQKLDNITEVLKKNLDDISNKVSEETWLKHFDQTKTVLNRFAREETLKNLRQITERQATTVTETLEEQGLKVLATQNKVSKLQEKMDELISLEDLSHLGEYLIDNVKKPLEIKFNPLLTTTAKEETIHQNYTKLENILNEVVKHEEIIGVKNEQESMNKFLFKLLKVIEDSQDHNHFLEEQINALSEKLTLVFEFMKRVSGV